MSCWQNNDEKFIQLTSVTLGGSQSSIVENTDIPVHMLEGAKVRVQLPGALTLRPQYVQLKVSLWVESIVKHCAQLVPRNGQV